MTDDEKQQEIVHVLELVTNALAENTPQKQKEREEENKSLRLGVSVLLLPMFSEWINNERNRDFANFNLNLNNINFDEYIKRLFERFDFIRKNRIKHDLSNQSDQVSSKYDEVVKKFIEVAKKYKFY